MAKVIETGADVPQPAPLTAEQRTLIAATVPVLAEHGVAITTHMYLEMLKAHPELRNVFSHSKQVRGHQADILARSIHAYASHIEDLTPILPFVERIAHKHASVHVQPAHYVIVGKYLMEAITYIVGADTFKGDLYSAWVAAYWNLVHIFINFERKLYEAAAWVGWREFIVEKKIKESDEITSYCFRPKDGQPLEPYRPGQYISIQRLVPELGIVQNRQEIYSLSDAPDPKHYRISVKREPGIRTHALSGNLDTVQYEHPGWMSNLLHETLNEGDIIELAYPFGEFFLDNSPSPVVLFSAGVGVTPLLSMLNTLVRAEGPTRQISWVQAVRNSRLHAFKAHVASVVQQHPNQIKKTVFYSEPIETDVLGKDYDVLGRLDLDKVTPEALRLDVTTTQYYVCGPENFMADIFKSLKARGVEGSRIHAEVFGAGATPE